MKDANIKPDYEEVFGGLAWDLDKAKYLLADIQNIFETADPEYPTRENIERIRSEYKHIFVMLGLMSDLVGKMNATVAPLA